MVKSIVVKFPVPLSKTFVIGKSASGEEVVYIHLFKGEISPSIEEAHYVG